MYERRRCSGEEYKMKTKQGNTFVERRAADDNEVDVDARRNRAKRSKKRKRGEEEEEEESCHGRRRQLESRGFYC